MFELFGGRLLDVGVQAVAVRVHGHDRREIIHPQMPHGFGNSEVDQVHTQHRLDRARIILSRAPDAVQVNRTALLQRRQR